MKKSEFNKTKFGNGDKIKYHGKIYDLIGVDLIEQLFGFKDKNAEIDDSLEWCRCENAEYLKQENE
jgi:hypothetical protein